MIQSTLFDDTPNPEAVKAMETRRKSKSGARTTDPASSHAADQRHTQSGKKDTNIERVTDLVYTHPGLTSKQLSKLTEEMDRHEIGRRLPNAEDRGLIHSKGRNSGSEITWWPGEAS